MNHSGHHPARTATDDCPTDCKELKVLTIDDDPTFLRWLELGFRQYKVNLLQAYHGAHGIWLTMTEKPDLVITDLKMPQGQGQDVVECLRNNSDTSHIPIIVVSAVRDDALKKRLRRLGVEAYLTKPFDFEDLRKAVECVITLEERTGNVERDASFK
jgi:DNA-binding response OmpR family regulator